MRRRGLPRCAAEQESRVLPALRGGIAPTGCAVKRKRPSTRDPLLCKVAMCPNPKSGVPSDRGMCADHALVRTEGRDICKQAGCGEPCFPPYSAKRCKRHHPSKQLTPIELEVIEEMAQGRKPIEAVQMVTGLPRPEAAKELRKIEKKAEASDLMRAVLEDNGLGIDALAGKISENTDARKTVVTKEGEVIDAGRDYRASNTAIDIALKLGGHYPAKKVEHEGKEGPVFNIQAIVVPQPKPLPLDQPIYTIEKSGK